MRRAEGSTSAEIDTEAFRLITDQTPASQARALAERGTPRRS